MKLHRRGQTLSNTYWEDTNSAWVRGSTPSGATHTENMCCHGNTGLLEEDAVGIAAFSLGFVSSLKRWWNEKMFCFLHQSVTPCVCCLVLGRSGTAGFITGSWKQLQRKCLETETVISRRGTFSVWFVSVSDGDVTVNVENRYSWSF